MANSNENTTVFGILPSTKIESTIKQSTYRTRRGIQFPFKNNGRGYVSEVVNVELAKANLKQLLSTRPGERLMLPNFGCDLESLLFEPFDEQLVIEAKNRVVNSITTYIPYLELTRVQVYRSDRESRFGIPTIVIKVFCQIRDDENTLFEVSVTV